MLALIQSNITEYGQHNYTVMGGCSPRFAYTIGNSQSLGFELVFAGGLFYSVKEVNRILNQIAKKLVGNVDWQNESFEIDSLGIFSLRKVDVSWSKMLILGALDFYDLTEIPTLQIVPDKAHWTADIADLSQDWSATLEPAWQWLQQPWDYSIAKNSMAVTNLDALRGHPVTEAVHWEEKQWELFAGAGPDVQEEEIREVPLATLLAIDPSVGAVANLAVGEGLWRDPADLEWQIWEVSK